MTCLTADWCSSELDPIKCVGLIQSGHHPFIECMKSLKITKG
jgi:hypothetical protein